MEEKQIAEARVRTILEITSAARDYFANAKTQERTARVVKAIDAAIADDESFAALFKEYEEKRAAKSAGVGAMLSLLGVQVVDRTQDAPASSPAVAAPVAPASADAPHDPNEDAPPIPRSPEPPPVGESPTVDALLGRGPVLVPDPPPAAVIPPVSPPPAE